MFMCLVPPNELANLNPAGSSSQPASVSYGNRPAAACGLIDRAENDHIAMPLRAIGSHGAFLLNRGRKRIDLRRKLVDYFERSLETASANLSCEPPLNI